MEPIASQPPFQQVADKFLTTQAERHRSLLSDDAAAERRRREAAWQQLVPRIGKRYEKATLDSFIVTSSEQRDVVDEIRSYLSALDDNIASGSGMLLYGPRGTGKDHLAVAALRVAVMDHGASVAWSDGQQLFANMRDRIGSDASESEQLAQFIKTSVLLISDPLPQAGALTEYQQSTLWRIIDRRYRDLRPTWVTLNVADQAEATQRLGAQLLDRLVDDAVCLHCNWPSHRSVRVVVKAPQGGQRVLPSRSPS